MAKQNIPAKPVSSNVAGASKDTPVLRIALSSILVDPKKNARSGDITAGGGDEEKHEFSQLVTSLKSNGQDNPIIVKPIKGNARYQYELVAGFRRVAALQAIATEASDKNPTVKAQVREDLTHASDAIALNARENVERSDMKASDVSFAINALKQALVKEGKFKSNEDVAQRLGVSQTYGNRLLTIAEKLRPNLFEMWRAQPSPIPTNTVWEIARKETADEQQAAWDKAVKGKGEKTQTSDPDAKLNRLIKKAEAAAELLGSLQAAEQIDCESLNFHECIDDIVGVDKLEKSERKALVKAAEKAFEEAARKAVTNGKSDSVPPPPPVAEA